MSNEWIASRGVVLSLNGQYPSTMVKESSFGEIKRFFVDAIGNALHDKLELFEGGKNIWPDQCDATISNLNMMIALVQKLCASIDNGSYSSIATTTSLSGNGLKVKLLYAHTQLCRLLDLVMAFRSTCQKGPKRAGKMREEISHRLKLFKLHSDDILQSIDFLQKEHLQESSSHQPSETTATISPPAEYQCPSCLQESSERDFVDPAQWKRSYPDYLRLVPKELVGTPHSILLETGEDTSESPFCG